MTRKSRCSSSGINNFDCTPAHLVIASATWGKFRLFDGALERSFHTETFGRFNCQQLPATRRALCRSDGAVAKILERPDRE